MPLQDNNSDVALVCVPRKRKLDAPKPDDDDDDDVPLECVPRRKAQKKEKVKKEKAKPEADAVAAASIAGVALRVVDGAAWPAPLRRLGDTWRVVLSWVSGDFKAMVHLERTSRRGAALAAVLAKSPSCPKAWRIASNPKVPKRARDTLWRISQPSARMAKHLVNGTCCLCGRAWTGAVDETFGVFAHANCVKIQLLNDKFIDEPAKEKYGNLPQAFVKALEATPLSVEQHMHLPRALQETFSSWTGPGYYDAVWLRRCWAVPSCYALETAIAAAAKGKTANVVEQARRVEERIKSNRRAQENATRRDALRAHASRVAVAEAACAPSGGYAAFERQLSAFGGRGGGNAKELVGTDYFNETLVKVEVSAPAVKLRLSLAQSLLSDKGFMQMYPYGTGHTFASRLLSALAFMKAKTKGTSKATPELLAYVKAALLVP